MSGSNKLGKMHIKSNGGVSITETKFNQWAISYEAPTLSVWAPLLLYAYRIRRLRRYCLSLIRRLEGGEFNSSSLRRILKDFHGVTIGKYSYGDCLVPGVLPSGTIMGNYCSVAEGLRVFRRNHPVRHLSQHPFFYNKEFGLVGEDIVERIADNPLYIGHDVWIGAGVTILPGCKLIGNGAVIGAGSVVTHDVAPFSINVGNPARSIGQRYSDEIIERIETTQWWSLPISRLAKALPLLLGPVKTEDLDEFISSLGQ